MMGEEFKGVEVIKLGCAGCASESAIWTYGDIGNESVAGMVAVEPLDGVEHVTVIVQVGCQRRAVNVPTVGIPTGDCYQSWVNLIGRKAGDAVIQMLHAELRQDRQQSGETA